MMTVLTQGQIAHIMSALPLIRNLMSLTIDNTFSLSDPLIKYVLILVVYHCGGDG